MRKSLFVAFIVSATAYGPVVAQAPIPGLENFTLDRSQPSPTPTPSAVPTVTPAPAPAPTVTPPATPTPTETSTPRSNPTAAERAPRPRATAATPAPSPTPTNSPIGTPTTAASSPAPVPTTTAPVAAAPTPTEEPRDWGLWIAVGGILLVLLGAFAWWRNRAAKAEFDEAAFAEPVVSEEIAAEPTPPPVEAAAPEATPVAPAAPEAPVPSPPTRPGGLITSSLKRSGGGLVTSTLAPELRLALAPLRGGVDTLRATLEYELQVGNAGRGMARSVAVEAWLISASHNTAADLAALFDSTPGEPLLAPFDLAPNGAIDLAGVVELPREMIATISAGERRMFVPVLAIRAGFIDGRGASQVITRAFLVGIRRDGQDRLAPLPLDRGARMNEDLAARPYGD